LVRRDLGIRDNFEAAGVSAGEISRLASELAAGKPDAILIWSTNLSGHSLTESLGAAVGIPIFDSAAIGTISALRRLQEISEKRQTGVPLTETSCHAARASNPLVGQT
jgi:maleate isomerase